MVRPRNDLGIFACLGVYLRVCCADTNINKDKPQIAVMVNLKTSPTSPVAYHQISNYRLATDLFFH